MTMDCFLFYVDFSITDITFTGLDNMSSTVGVFDETGTAYLSRVHESTPVFDEVRVEHLFTFLYVFLF